MLYGPLPYRTVQETIGEHYLVLPLIPEYDNIYYYLFFKNSSKKVTTKEGEGKLLKLISINDNQGELIDSAGNTYISKMDEDKTLLNLTPVSDIENARKLLLNKPLWLNINEYYTGDPYNQNTYKTVSNVRFTRVTVIDILASFSNDKPLFFIFKTDKGEIGFDNVSVSGTNSLMEPGFSFNEKFWAESPQIKYKLTPKLWEAVKAHDLQIGMPAIAVELMYGRPDRRNTTTTTKTVTEQWVYGTSASTIWYIYFTNGKVTSVSR